MMPDRRITSVGSASLTQPATTLQQELDLVRAYLEVMHMRMPDRLRFVLHADDSVLALHCPTMTLLTLVENAVRHGIDPSEVGGRIEVRVARRDARVSAQVIDTGVGLRGGSEGLGTGLANLRERLKLAYRDDAQLRLIAVEPTGTCAGPDVPPPAVSTATPFAESQLRLPTNVDAKPHAALTTVAPSAGEQGGVPVLATITGIGTHFQQGVSVVSLGTGVSVGNVTVISPTQLQASMAVAVGASPGLRTVRVATGGD